MVEHSLWERKVARSDRVAPICIHTTTMHIYSVEYWQKNWDELMERVENGEHIGIENENGERAVMVPADDELIRIYTEHNEAS